MTGKKLNLDDATVRIMRRILSAPPKPHKEMKVGRPAKKKEKKRATKGRASSAKQRTA
jgi:hypothetical protein